MPEMVRTWIIPTSGTSADLAIELCEPPLTGDSLGLKTWGTSFVMAKKLEEIGDRYFKHILFHHESGKQTVRSTQSGPDVQRDMNVKIELTMGVDETIMSDAIMNGKTTTAGETMVSALSVGNDRGRILELGSGTGLLGLTASMLWDRTTILTDLPDIVPNLNVNLKRNGFDQTSDTLASAEILDWSDAEGSVVFSQSYEDKFEV